MEYQTAATGLESDGGTMWMWIALALAGPQEGRSRDKSEIKVVMDGDADILRVHNTKAYPITFTVELGRASNVKTKPKKPVDKVLKPGERYEVQFLHKSKDAGMSYLYAWSYSTGSNKAKHKPKQPYRLPWPAKKSFECIQGFDGRASHMHEHAVDIAMPKGTPVLAARAGRVIDIVDGWPDGGTEPDHRWESNKVRVLHDDGTYADYANLLAGKMKVKLGQQVAVGKPLGQSGASGFGERPHLHFVVYSALDGWVYRSHVPQFAVGGQAIVLRPGQRYPKAKKKPTK